MLTVFHPFGFLSYCNVDGIPMKLILGGPLSLTMEVERERSYKESRSSPSIIGMSSSEAKGAIDENRTLIARKHLICFPKDFGICQNI